MAVTLNSNIASMRTVRALGSATAQLSRTFERLSSGLRIVHPSDDAAGLAIGTSLGVDNRIFNRARLNVNDANSALQIADGAAGEISGLLSRMAELSEQAANGTLGTSQRKRLDDEYQQLSLEVRRIAGTTSFNGRALMSGQRIDRGLVTVHASGIETNVGLSGDGNLIYYLDGANGTLNQKNMTTGQIRTISSGYPSATSNSVAANGDVFYIDNAQRLFRFNADTNTSDYLGRNDLGIIGTALSADGSSLLYLQSDSDYSLYALDLNTGTQKTIYSNLGGHASTLQISADGSKAIFISANNLTGQNAAGNSQIFKADVSGSSPVITQLTNFTTSGSIQNTAIANDGTAYVLTTGSDTGALASTSRLLRYAADGSRTVLATSSQGLQTIGGLTLGSDGKTLTFVGAQPWTGENTSNVMQAFRFNVESNSMTQLTQISDGRFDDYSDMLFSGDGNRILFNDGATSTVYTQDVSLGDESVSMEVGYGNRGGISTTLAALNGSLKGLGGMTLSSARSARAALVNARENIDALARMRGVYGASQSRLEVAHNILSTQVLNGESARSQIMDADIAGETATLIRSQILQQAASSLLAQANQQPALALQLIGK